ncbi:immunoglobulin gamma-1 heavy chain-like [Hypanus sabinus]|uniref:immunoglobulin gamma-1 heavy chain-like n=1 Tax=Hypanus sabinus TaxID=79690 RepID=UPI0028C457BD|nr:immunoglobulin gamma-1 heavy chain-like [Hypanus sabinus]
MAAKQQVDSLKEEVTCRICHEFFINPVILKCGHNFCQRCITRRWERETRNSCPECNEVFVDRTLNLNPVLGSLARKAQDLTLTLKQKERKLQCEEHQEELKLFCETDKKLICVICSSAREHREHQFIPVNEAVDILKNHVQSTLEALEKKKSVIQEMADQQKQKISGVRDLSLSLQAYVKSLFADLHQILTEREQHLLGELSVEAQRVMNPMENNLRKIQENLSSLQNQLSKLQERMVQQDNVTLLKEEYSRKGRISEEERTFSILDGALPVKQFSHASLLKEVLSEECNFLKQGPVLADDTLYISPISTSRRENETVTLDCFTSRNLDDHFFFWGSAKPTDQLISWILFWTPGFTEPVYSEPRSSRFIGSKDWTSKKFSLTIQDLQREDSARYYCGTSNSYFSLSTDWSGCGVTLTVDAAPPQSPPEVYLNHPSPKDVLEHQEITLLCVAEDFYPEPISISWWLDGEEVDARVSHSVSLLGPNATYTKISKLTTSTSQWIKGSVYACHVSHDTLPSPISKQVSSSGQYLMAPRIHLLPPTLEEMDIKEQATITCQATGYYPAEISFRWFADGNPVLTDIKSYASVLNDNGTYSSQSELVTSPENWNQGSVYSCSIQHISLPSGMIQSIKRKDTEEQKRRTPTISALKVESEQKVTLVCYVSGFFPADIYVSWRTDRGVPERVGVTNFPVVSDSIGTYSTASQMTIPLSNVSRSRAYVCVVGHESLSYPGERRFHLT